jgi:branched-chain amino acid transport system substrate-binding protein
MKSGLTVILAAALLITACSGSGSREPLVIGMQADRTGGISSWGYWIEKAAVAAVEDINREGGISGRQVRLAIEDTETNAQVGARKFRKLVQSDRADVIIGSVHSGVMMATVPIATELKTPYFPIAMASEATEEQGNRYTFRINSHVHQQVNAAVRWMLEKVGRRWTLVVSDYAWGWSHEKYFGEGITTNGGQVLARIRVPQGTKDFYPYIGRIPRETEAVYFIFFGADTLGFIQQLHERRPDIKKNTVICTLEAIDIPRLGEAVEGMYVLEYLPRYLSEFDTPEHRKLRQRLGVDDSGREIGNPGRTVAGSHYWASYQLLWHLKRVFEQVDYRSREDIPKLIARLETTEAIPQGEKFPQGEVTWRADDHQGFHDHFMSRIQKGTLKVLFRIPRNDVMYPPMVQLPGKPL